MFQTFRSMKRGAEDQDQHQTGNSKQEIRRCTKNFLSIDIRCRDNFKFINVYIRNRQTVKNMYC